MPSMKRKKPPPLDLAHPELFDKDSTKKKATWNAKAKELGQGSGVLLTWYHSMRLGMASCTRLRRNPGQAHLHN